jgi:hypothetical protein
MNAESTVFRASRPAVVVAPGGEGARAAAWLLSWPMRLAATPMGRRLLVAVALAVVAVAAVSFLYDSADRPSAPVAFRAAGGSAPSTGAGTGNATRQLNAAPVRARQAATAAEVAAAWWAARQHVDLAKVQPLQQRKVGADEVQVMVMAEAGSQMPSQWVTVRKGPSGWKVP